MQHRSRLTIELLCARVRRLHRRMRARLCRSSTLLLGLLVLGLGEPLLCIIHCELAEALQELQSRQSMVSMHHHDMMGHMGMSATPEAAAMHGQHQHGPAAGGQTHGRSAADCLMPAGGSDPSPLTPPSPIHDLLLTTLALLSTALACTAHLPLSRLQPRYLGKPPPCPPPIPVA